MTAKVGYPTLRLVRAGIGPFVLAGLQPGEWRLATEEELGAVLPACDAAAQRSPAAFRRKRPKSGAR